MEIRGVNFQTQKSINMSKFKVGDKVRVIDNSFGYKLGYVGIITRDDNDGTYQLDKSRLWIGYPRLEPVTPLTFDHAAALNGAPVYLDGIVVYPQWNPASNDWTWGIYRFDSDGKCRTITIHTLTTIPPVEYVEESRWVWVAKNGDTSPLYRSENTAMCMTFPGEGTTLCKVTIKVKK